MAQGEVDEKRSQDIVILINNLIIHASELKFVMPAMIFKDGIDHKVNENFHHLYCVITEDLLHLKNIVDDNTINE